jgi:two-component system OmpR family sensor kinase
VEIAHAEAEHLSKLAVDLLVLARQRAGALGLERRDVDLYDVARRTVARLTPLLSTAVQVEGQPSPAAVDVVRIEQLLTNLVTNAAEAGAERVDVHVGSRDGRALLRVVDDGPGFPPDLLDTAFDRFTRADRARTRRGGSHTASTGAGLGLPIAAAIARAHGGDIHISNGSPQGACVQVELPSAPGPTRSEDP